MKEKKTIILVIATVLVIVLVALILMSPPTSAPPAANDTEPTSSANEPEADKNLEECLARVNNSEASQTIIEQGLEDCRNRFK